MYLQKSSFREMVEDLAGMWKVQGVRTRISLCALVPNGKELMQWISENWSSEELTTCVVH